MLTASLYEKIIKKVLKPNIETAEFVKLYENIYRSINIGLVNELKIVSKKLKLDIYEIIQAAKPTIWFSTFLSRTGSRWTLYTR